MKALVFVSLLLLSACSFSAIPPAAARPGPTGEPEDEIYYPAERYTASQVPKPEDFRCVDAVFLNIRLGPGVEYPVEGFLNNGDVVKVLESVNGWVKIQSGWVRELYLVRCDE